HRGQHERGHRAGWRCRYRPARLQRADPGRRHLAYTDRLGARRTAERQCVESWQGARSERRRAGGKRKRQALLCKVYKASLPNVPPNVPPPVAGLLMIHASTSVDSHATVLPVGVSERGRGNCPNRTHRYNVVRDTATRWSTSRKRSRRGAREAVVVSI